MFQTITVNANLAKALLGYKLGYYYYESSHTISFDFCMYLVLLFGGHTVLL